MTFRWGTAGTFQRRPAGHMWQIMTEHYKEPKPVPFTMAFGVPVAATLLAGGGFDYAVLPRGGDEIGAAGAVQGFPMRYVKCRTIDAYTLADAEYVLEGAFYPQDKHYQNRESEKTDTQHRFDVHRECTGT